jgi:sugar phosphate permease
LDKANTGNSTRWAIFAVLSSMFMLSQFYRASNAVIAPVLVRDLALNAESLGLLGGAFFYAFAVIQLPMGPAIDRIGPRVIVAFLPLVSALGAFLFAVSGGFSLAFLARLLIGVGMAGVLIGSFKVFAAWFSPDEFATMNGLTYAIGMVGSIGATSPLAFAASLLGWRISFVIIGLATVLICAAVYKIVRDRPEKAEYPIPQGQVSGREEKIPLLLPVRTIFGNLVFWQIAATAFLRYGTFVAIQGLWGGPYLIDILGYSPVKAGHILMMPSMGAIIGAPLSGRLSDKVFLSRKKVVLGGMCAYAAGMVFLTGWLPVTHELFHYGVFFSLGLFSSCGMVLYSQIKESFDIRIAATAMTAVNFFTMMGGAIFMQGMGGIIEMFPAEGGAYSPRAYHAAFLVCLLAMVLAIAFYSFSKDTKPSRRVPWPEDGA